jgi:hypothetical protein
MQGYREGAGILSIFEAEGYVQALEKFDLNKVNCGRLPDTLLTLCLHYTDTVLIIY